MELTLAVGSFFLRCGTQYLQFYAGNMESIVL